MSHRTDTAADTADTAAAAAGAAAAGGAPFRFRERVRWEDIDLVGIMRYSAYTRFHDAVEAELLRAIGWPTPAIIERLDVWLPRRVLHLEYHAPARFDDELEARLWVATVGSSSITLAGELWSADGATRHASWHLVLVCVDGRTLEKRPVPDELAHALTPYRWSVDGTVREG